MTRSADSSRGCRRFSAAAVATALGITPPAEDEATLRAAAAAIRTKVGVNTVVIHPTHYALAVSAGDSAVVEGPFTPKPLITTGAGDHFNAGFCLGKLLGFDNALSVLTGVSTSGFYVRTAKSPAISDLAGLLQNWPV